MSDDPTKRTRKFQNMPAKMAVNSAKVRIPKTKKRDFSQVALAVVEKAIGGKLAKR